MKTSLLWYMHTLLKYFFLSNQIRGKEMFKRIREIYEWGYLLWKDKRAQFGAGVVGTLVGIMVSLLIAIIIVMNLVTSQTQSGWSKQANETWATLQSNIWTALTLLVIIPIIVGAVIILSYVRRGF